MTSTASKPNFPAHVFTPPTDVASQARMFVAETATWFSANALRIVVALAVGAVLVAALLFVQKLAQRLCRDNAALVDWKTIVGRVASKTSFWFLVVVAARLVDGYADTPPLLDKTIGFLFTVALTFQAAVWLRELTLGFVEHRAGMTDQDHGALASATGIIRFLVSFTLFSLALVLVLGNLGVNVTGLVAGLGVGGIAIGLAAQGIFKDLFAALAIIFDRPFRKGDSIKWNGISGNIEAIGLKTTRIRAVTGEQVVVGNAYMLEKELFNLARLDRRRMILSIGVTYYTSEDVCDRIPDMLRTLVAAVPKCKVVRVGMIGFGDSSLDYELQFDVASSNYNEVFDARSQVCLRILRAFNQAGIEFAFPTQTTITADPSGRGIMPYPEATPHQDETIAATDAPASPDRETSDETAP